MRRFIDASVPPALIVLAVLLFSVATPPTAKPQGVPPLLCPIGGNDGATVFYLPPNDTSFTDRSAKAHGAPTASGMSFDTSIVKWSRGSAKTAGSNTNSLLWPTSTDWTFGTNLFTMDFWIYFASSPATQSAAMAAAYKSTGNNRAWYLALDGAGHSNFVTSSDGTNNVINMVGSNTFPTTTWTHVAIERSAGNVFTLFFNGAVDATTTNSTTLYPSSTAVLGLLNNDQNNFGFSIVTQMTGFRISNVARYGGAAFAPPQAPYCGG